MIHYLSGILKEKNPTDAVLDVQGVGYQLKIPLSTYEKLPAVNHQCSLHTHLYLSLSQDEIKLYGFATVAEKAVFIKLISISGIGPKIALSLISSMNIGMFVKAVQSGEEGLLAKVPGIGKKTAQRLIVELRDNIGQFADLLDSKERAVQDLGLAEVEKALIALGYSYKDVHSALPKLSPEDKKLPIEQQIKQVIRIIYKKP